MCEHEAPAEAFSRATPLERRPERPVVPPEGLDLVETLEGFQVTRSTRSWTALLVWPFFFVWSGGWLYFIGTPQFTGTKVDWVVALVVLMFVLISALLLYVAFMASFGSIELSYSKGMLRLRQGGLGIYATNEAPWTELVSAERQQYVDFDDNGSSVTYACVLRFRQGREWRFSTDTRRDLTSWLVRYLSEWIYLRRVR